MSSKKYRHDNHVYLGALKFVPHVQTTGEYADALRTGISFTCHCIRYEH
jgi:hypothetical protein